VRPQATAGPPQGAAGGAAMIIGIDARELGGRATGTGRYLRSLMSAWSGSGTERFIAYLDAPPQTPLPSSERYTWRALASAPVRGLVWQERLLAPAARRDRVDVLFAPAYQCPLSIARPRVTAVHDLSFFFCAHDFGLVEGLRRRLLVAASIRASRAILACSRFTRDEIARRFPDAAGRVHHVPLGADDSLPLAPAREEARRRLGLAGPLILWVGSVFNRRCLPELLAAGALLRDRWPDLRIDIIGDNRTRPQRDLEALARQSDMTEHVRYSGFVDDDALALRYAAADVLVQLSDYEGFGLPALEAMARGVPVVASDRPALSEVAGDAACAVNPRDPREIAQALARVLGDSAFALRLRDRGRARAARFSWDATAARVLAILRQAAKP
jgi:glycosyltransferase involved in cell wall biosynthesis